MGEAPQPGQCPELEPIIEMVDVNVGLAGGSAEPRIKGINWTINPGDYWIVGGLEETGKSELLTTAFGLQRPLAGRLKIFGREVTRLSQEDIVRLRLRMGMVFESGGRLLRRLTVFENIALPLQYHEILPHAEVAQAIERIAAAMDITSCLDKMPGRIPRSAQQRIGLARALISRPEILFLDKPVLGLDPKERRWWLEFLEALHTGHPLLEQRPLTLVLTTEDLRNWRQPGRQFAAIRNRRWTVIGGLEDLDQSGDPHLRELLWSDFFLE